MNGGVRSDQEDAQRRGVAPAGALGMGLLRFVAALHAELGVSVPQPDYRRIVTVRGCAEYLAEKLGQQAA